MDIEHSNETEDVEAAVKGFFNDGSTMGLKVSLRVLSYGPERAVPCWRKFGSRSASSERVEAKVGPR